LVVARRDYEGLIPGMAIACTGLKRKAEVISGLFGELPRGPNDALGAAQSDFGTAVKRRLLVTVARDVALQASALALQQGAMLESMVQAIDIAEPNPILAYALRRTSARTEAQGEGPSSRSSPLLTGTGPPPAPRVAFVAAEAGALGAQSTPPGESPLAVALVAAQFVQQSAASEAGGDGLAPTLDALSAARGALAQVGRDAQAA